MSEIAIWLFFNPPTHVYSITLLRKKQQPVRSIVSQVRAADSHLRTQRINHWQLIYLRVSRARSGCART